MDMDELGYFLYMDKMEKQQKTQQQLWNQQLNSSGQEDEESDRSSSAGQTWPF